MKILFLIAIIIYLVVTKLIPYLEAKKEKNIIEEVAYTIIDTVDEPITAVSKEITSIMSYYQKLGIPFTLAVLIF